MVDKTGGPASEVKIVFSSEGNGLRAAAETDRQGRFRAALVPGLPYRMGISPRLPTSPRLLRPVDVLAESGRTKDLGDLILGK